MRVNTALESTKVLHSFQGNKETLSKIFNIALDSAIRAAVRTPEGVYDLAELPLAGPGYRGVTEFVRQGVVAFLKDTEGHKDNYKKRLSTTFVQTATRTTENLVGFLAFKTNQITSAIGRALAGFGNMFVRLLPRMVFVANDLTPAKLLNTSNLLHEFFGRTFMRMLPRNVWGMLLEQMGIGMLLEYTPLSLALKDSVANQES